jgi:hypothetical protein
MADFSALCPLFNTGMYSEISFPDTISLISRSTTNKFAALPPFSRSVIVTHAYVSKNTTFAATATAVKLAICRAATWAATRTVFGTINLSATVTAQPINKYLAFTIATAKTFSATQILHLKALKKEAGARGVKVIIRYKEK